jgi:hypothetical protein
MSSQYGRNRFNVPFGRHNRLKSADAAIVGEIVRSENGVGPFDGEKNGV